jgi:cytoskeletal protein RodZ
MANTNEEFDRIFREKLGDHQEKPSALAWERLENQLPKSKSSFSGIWWAVAASVTVILAAGWMFWNTSDEVSNPKMLAEQTQNSTEKPNSSSNEPQVSELGSTAPKVEIQPQKTLASTTTVPRTESKKTDSTPISSPPMSTPNFTENLVAVTQTSQAEREAVQIAEVAEATEITLPQIQPQTSALTVAEASPAPEDGPLFRVNIYSDGLKKSPEPEKNLITEMGKTVGKVEGLLGKVDEGFAEIQDKKNNLFATLTSKK